VGLWGGAGRVGHVRVSEGTRICREVSGGENTQSSATTLYQIKHKKYM